MYSEYEGYYVRSQKIRRLIQQDFDNVFYRLNPTRHNIASNISMVKQDHQGDQEYVHLILT